MKNEKSEKKAKYVAPKYPRIMVSPRRHEKLAREAARKGMTLTALAEQKLKRD